ncbi:MAG: hypothetical protein A2445_02600 [Candidatus Jacksonbacteria bacterium RIFOXYC2_FULL_44_29]|nr:MAG: VanW family protein [Parcubacteria group bacterium GW2011_GWA2_42_28]KKT55892.1 MAG: VanW family protein [Parcubacteria group bacterium GW2011_GWC2_44_22]OGY74506.1 MAG: hypothetical protein A2240_02855 [Candidatus Jacksonbacteria bacterium RIFOXYA2_FULL_43_12]OGY77415.1 MAG: hypothetical protein A2295_01805 [Candidatus Jacksonbacteria bacterium RIFOXYB2_FULL_44_15]OGY78187.1 MAG: hypothetical protein A2550_06150 [Candidatus Jacksonbacteria bacterium RIFOXYD2_FULL_43_21]OGY80765.1 MAG:
MSRKNNFLAHNFERKEIGVVTANRKKRLRYLAVFFLIIWFTSFSFLMVVWGYEIKYQGRVYAGIMLGRNKISGLKRAELAELINNYKRSLESDGMLFTYKNQQVTVWPQVVATTDPDLTYELVSVNTEATLENIMEIGRTGDFWPDFKSKIELLRNPRKILLQYTLYDDKFKATLQENFKDQEMSAHDAKLQIDNNLKIMIIPEESGIMPDYDAAIAQTRNALSEIAMPVVTLTAKKDLPKVTVAELSSKKAEMEQLFISRSDIFFKYTDSTEATTATETLLINKNQYKDWLSISDGMLAFNDGLIAYLQEHIAPAVELPVQEARFQLTSSGKVSEFKPSSEGRQISYAQTLEATNKFFFDESLVNEPIEIITEKVLPKYSTESINDLGIKEIVGIGKSNFAGSPANRRHNIAVGAAALNGLLVPPGEEFSLAAALGAIDGQNGYLPELVIKGNRTIPEYGGGLCQIGTTLFRGALQSGLEITERRSHSYRVVYYEPAGTDCTIYPPHPDCRFRNNMSTHILIQTTIKGNEVFFEFWGTKDGRQVTISDPKIYNITKPPAKKFIETTDIAPGITKCTESAHNGADTQFDYAVVYADGTKKEETFYSHYRPWQAVCLVGKSPDTGNSTLNPDVATGDGSVNNTLNPPASLPAASPATGLTVD